MTLYYPRLLLSSLLILLTLDAGFACRAHYRLVPVTQVAINLKDFAGTWEQQPAADSTDKLAVTLVITVSGAELRIVKKTKVDSSQATETYNYFSDGRGESNPDADKEGRQRSVTRWQDGKVVVKYLAPPSTARSSTNSYEEWSLSADAKTLTQTIVSSGVPLPESKGTIARRGSMSAPRQTTETRIFKRLA